LMQARCESGIIFSFRNMAPYLAVPQKMIYIGQSKLGSVIFPFHNLHLKKGNLSEIARIKFKGNDRLKFINGGLRKKAWVAREYRMDVSRYAIGFIRAAYAEGAEVFVGCAGLKKENNGDEILIKGKHRGKIYDFRAKYLASGEIWPTGIVARFNLPHSAIEFLNPVRIEKKDLSLLFFHEDENWAVRLETTKALQNLSRIEQEIKSVFPDAENIKLYREGLNCRNHCFYDLVLKKIQSEHHKIASLFPLYSEMKLEDVVMPGGEISYNNEWRSVSEFCDTRYDEAKQTNIDSAAFRKLFFRYGNEIEGMTERAYELMELTRDPIEIWEKAEDEFLKEKEWKKAMDLEFE